MDLATLLITIKVLDVMRRIVDPVLYAGEATTESYEQYLAGRSDNQATAAPWIPQGGEMIP